MDKDIRVTGGNKRRVQKRKVRKDGFTDAKRQIYLDTLAGCGIPRGKVGRPFAGVE